MSSTLVEPRAIQKSEIERPLDLSVGGRLCRFAGEVFSFAPSLARSLKVSVSTLALGSVVTTSLVVGEANAQACTANTSNDTTTYTCNQSSISAPVSFSVSTSDASNKTVNLSASTSARVNTGTAAFSLYSVKSGNVIFSQAANGGDIEAIANVSTAILVANMDSASADVSSTVTISVTGEISVTNSSSFAVRAFLTRGTDLASASTKVGTITISTADIVAGGGGIYTKSKGSVSITADTITASGKDGINIFNDEADTSNANINSIININVSSISVSNSNESAVYFNVRGAAISTTIGSIAHTATGTNGNGITIINMSGDNTVQVTVGSATVANEVFSMSSDHSGTTSFTVTGAITARAAANIRTSGDINVRLNSFSARTGVSTARTVDVRGNNITVSASGTIQSRNQAIFVDHSGNATITITGDITGSNNSGTIQTKQNSTSRARVTITTTGDVTNTSTTANGAIFVKGERATRTDIRAKNVTSSGFYAINVDLYDGTANVTVSGSVQATSTADRRVAAIRIDNTSRFGSTAPAASVTLNSGAVVGRVGKDAVFMTGEINAQDFNGTVTVNSGASLLGAVGFWRGDDEIKFNSGGSYTLGSGQKIDGGTRNNDNDLINFNTGSWTVTATNFINWERLKIGSGATAKFLGKVVVDDQGTTVDTTQDLPFSRGVIVDGILSLQDGVVGDQLDIAKELSGSGVIFVDINFATKKADQVLLKENVSNTANIKIRLNDVTPTGTAHVVDSNIRIITIDGNSPNTSSISLENTTFFAGGYKYTVTVAESKYIDLQAAPAILRCVESGSNTGIYTCSGSIAGTESILRVGSANITVSLDASATVSISSSVAFDISGQNGISFTQAASGGALTGSGTATGLVSARTTGNGVVSVALTGSVSLSGSGTAILAKSTGTGTVMVESQDVTASNASGTAVHAEGAGANVTVTSRGTISAGNYGLLAKNTGSTGLVTVTATAPVTSSGDSAIYAYGKGRGVTVNVSWTGSDNAITGSTTGIKAVNMNSAESVVSVTVTGNIETSAGDAIHITNSSNGGVTLNILGNITGGTDAVDIRNEKGGNVSVTATGHLDGTGSSSTDNFDVDGIYVRDNGTGSITILADDVTGRDDGIDARNHGGGSVSVTVTGDVEGQGDGQSDAGIYVYGFEDSNSVSVGVAAGAESKGGYGIYVRNHGTGGVTVSATGDLEGLYFDGVYVRNSGTTIDVHVMDVVAYEDGIDVRAKGTGNATITVASGGSVIAENEESYGIYVEGSNRGNLTVSVFGEVYGYERGVYVDNSGAGDVFVTVGSSGESEGGEKEGIYVKSRSGAGNVSVTVSGESKGTLQGVNVTNSGSGTVTLGGSGTIESSDREGVLVTNAGGALSVDLGTVRGKTEGIEIANTGNGAVTLAVDTVTADNEGVLVSNSGSGPVSIDVGNATSQRDAVKVNGQGAGTVTLTSTGTITTTGSLTDGGSTTYFSGVEVSSQGAGLSITVNNVSATEHGINAENNGSGTSTVTVNGAIVLTGSGGQNGVNLTGATGASSSVTLNSGASISGGKIGINVKARTTEDVSVATSGSVTVANQGIIASNEGIGDVSIVIDGNVTVGSGLTDHAISTLTQGGSATVTINSGIITGTTSIQGDESNSVIFLNTSGELKGDVKLSGGVDQMTIDGGKFDQAKDLDGGEDIGTDSSVDVLTFSSGRSAVVAGNLKNWEKIVISSGATVVAEGTGVLDVAELDLGSGGILSLSQGTVGSADDAITVTGNLTGSGIIHLDGNFEESTKSVDSITIQGDVIGQHKIRLTSVTEDVPLTEGPIKVATVTGTATESSIVLENTSFGASGFVYTLTFNATDKTYSLVGTRGTLLCVESTETKGVYACAGAINSAESILKIDGTEIRATLASTATVSVTSGVALLVQGGGNVSFTQEPGGGAITASGASRGVVHATSTGNGNVSINVVGASSLAGSGTAIFATAVGTGTIAVNVAAVTASHTGATAIHVSGKGDSVTVGAGAITGGYAGVVVKNTSATGTVTVGLTGAVTSSGGTAIDVEGNGLSVTLAANSTVTGATTGAKVSNTNSGSGSVTVTISGAVTATNSAGVHVSNSGTGDVGVTVAAVTGSGYGIVVNNVNGGTITLTVSGSVTASGTTDDHAGIQASNDTRGNGITLNARAVSGGTGVHVANGGAGGIVVTITGAVTGTVGDGISVTNSGTTTSITAGNITAKQDGISLQGNGTGDESITVVSGSTVTAEGNGINFKMVEGGNGTVTVVGTISADLKGIYVDNTTGTGDVSVTVASGASVAGTHGIHVMTLSAAGATSLTVNGAVSGTTSGIHFVDTTDSAVTITGAGSVSSEAGDAIYVSATRSGGVSVGIGSATSSGASGIDVRNVGTESLAISATGQVTGSGTAGIGINAHNGATGTDLTVNAATVTGVSGGIIVVNEGSGATSVTATGLVTASGGDGINVDSRATTTGLTISSTGATGHVGIKAVHLGPGNLTLTDSGNVTGNGTGSGNHGIHAQLSASGTNLAVTAGSVTGADSGIVADNDGSGTTTVVATGNVVGQTSVGIHAENVSGAGAVSVTASGATGETWGIQVMNNASGTDTSVTTTGSVVGKGNHGIDVTLSASLGDITISAAAVTGKLSAIKAEHAGDANILIRTSGRVATSDANEHGIEATLAGASGDVTSSGIINIFVASEVIGGAENGRGIMATSETTNITLNSGAIVRAASGVAIETGNGRSTVTVNEGGRVSGNVRLGRGVDIVSFNGGTLGAVIFDGGEEPTSGDGTAVDVSRDVFNFNQGTFDITSAQFNNFEQFNIKDFSTVIVNGNRTLTADEFSIDGTIMMVDSVANDSLTIAGNMAGGGTIQIDADLFTGRVDTFSVTGNVTGSTTIKITDISQRFGAGQQNNITVVRVGGTANASNFKLERGSIISGSYQYLLDYDEDAKTFNLIGRSTGAPMLLAAPVAFFDGFARAPSLHQRRTDRSFSGPEGETSTRGGWSRLINGNFAYGNAQNERAEYDTDATGFQLGYDFAEMPVEGGSWVYGVTSQYNEVKAGVNIDEFGIAGTMTATGYGIGATATYYNLNGAYVDIQAQYNNINANFPTQSLGLLMNGVKSTAMLFSLELGQRYRVNDEVSLVSHGQVAWGQVDTDDFVTEQDQKVSFGADGGLTARIGMGGEYHDERYSSFVLMNFFYDAFNEWNVAYEDETVTDTVGATEVELQFGGSTNIDQNAALFVQAGYRTSIEGGDGERSSTNFSMGMRWSW